MLFVKSKVAIFLLEALGSPFCRHRLGGSEGYKTNTDKIRIDLNTTKAAGSTWRLLQCY
jgi:hypothetical protein